MCSIHRITNSSFLNAKESIRHRSINQRMHFSIRGSQQKRIIRLYCCRLTSTCQAPRCHNSAIPASAISHFEWETGLAIGIAWSTWKAETDFHMTVRTRVEHPFDCECYIKQSHMVRYPSSGNWIGHWAIQLIDYLSVRVLNFQEKQEDMADNSQKMSYHAGEAKGQAQVLYSISQPKRMIN